MRQVAKYKTRQEYKAISGSAKQVEQNPDFFFSY
jgi:hypothetical protein